MSSPGGISPAIVAARVLDGVSAEVQAVLDNMPNPVSAADEARIIAIVDPAVADGTWAQIDFFFCFAMADAVNALTSWVGTKTATNVNASVHAALQGYNFNGTTQRLDTNINLTDDTTNFTLDDNHTESYCFDNQDATGIRAMFGDTSTANRFLIRQDPTASRMRNANFSGETSSVTDSTFLDATRYGLRRQDSADYDYMVNGAVDLNVVVASTSLTTISPSVGAVSNGAGAVSFLDGTVSYLLVGGGFNLANLDTMLDTVETEFSL